MRHSTPRISRYSLLFLETCTCAAASVNQDFVLCPVFFCPQISVALARPSLCGFSGMLCRSHLHCHTCAVSRAPAEEAPFYTPVRELRRWSLWPVKTSNVLFKGTTPPLKSSRLPTPFSSSLFMTHGHMIVARRACPLLCARARVHIIHTRQGDTALRGCVQAQRS